MKLTQKYFKLILEIFIYSAVFFLIQYRSKNILILSNKISKTKIKLINIEKIFKIYRINNKKNDLLYFNIAENRVLLKSSLCNIINKFLTLKSNYLLDKKMMVTEFK